MMKILIVDDKLENSYLLESLLKGNGYETVSAKNGADALIMASKDQPALIVSDILMPVMDGFTFCRECKKNELLKKVPFVFYTATYTSPKDEEFALSLGADKFILKPQDPDVFIGIIKEVLNEVKEEKIKPHVPPAQPEEIILKEYNAALIRKLEDKMRQAEEAEKELRGKNIELQKEIEEHKQTEEALRNSEEKFRITFENASVGMCLTSLDGYFITVNNALCLMLGYTKEELSNKRLIDFTLKDDIEPDFNWMGKMISGKMRMHRFEKIFLHKNGSRVFVDVNVALIKGVNDRPLFFVTHLVNITDQRKIQEELRDYEERFRMVFENVFDGICIYSEDADPFKRKLIECNERYAFMAGRSREELLQTGYTQKFQISQEEYANNNRLEALAEEREYKGSFSWVRPDGKENVIEYVGRPIKWRGKSYSIGIDRDITERKRVENELRKLSRAVEQSPASVIITDTNGNIEYINSKVTEISGYKLEEVIGRNPRIFSSGEKSPIEYKVLWDTIISGKEWYGELHNKKKNGELYWESATISPILNEKGLVTNFIALKEDITERKRMLEELIVAKEKAEQSDKLKTEFLEQMSHEIRTPMNSIICFTDLLKDDYFEQLTQEFSDILNSISTAGRRIIRTVDLILNASEMQIGTYHPSFKNINLGEKVLNIIKTEYSTLAKQKGLHLTFNDNLPASVIYGDDYSINQIFINLIDNAVKYTDSGEVDVLIDRNKEDNIFVTVSDTGVGISEDYFPHLFEPFMQEERGYTRRYDGNGLGLSLVKKYCDLNGITIHVESHKEKGSKFMLTFTKK